MCKWWVGSIVLFLLAAQLQAARPLLSARIDDSLEVELTRDQEIVLLVKPANGDAWSRLALRVTGDAEQWQRIAEFNKSKDSMRRDRPVRVPIATAKPELQLRAVRALFPKDKVTSEGWRHEVIAPSGEEGESLWKIAEWLTGDGANYVKIRKANRAQKLSTRRGDVVLVPQALLSPPFATGRKAGREENAEDDPVDSPEVVSRLVSASEEVAAAEPISLEYRRENDQPYAVYRLRRGEALYSSVAIRFTGRVFANDVNEVVRQIVDFNGISDVARIPAGYPIKIPMELLTTEYRPSDDPTRLARERTQREAARVTKRVGAKDLKGVHVILDAGHGGRDVGTTHDGTWESVYVYDIVVRLKKLLETRSDARVSMTTRSESAGYRIPERDVLSTKSDHVVLTTPAYNLEDAIVGVNLRWYLANSIFQKALDQKVSEERVVFISVHADSLHASLRGAMAYVPGGKFTQGSFRKRGDVYLARAEVRKNQVVTHSADDALRAEGLSTKLAESVIGAFRESHLKVHPYNAIRDNVVRDGREWVPAVIRFNKVPTRLLLEVCNLGNEKDREQIRTREHRQKIAEAIYRGIGGFYAQSGGAPGDLKIQAAAR